MVQSQTGTPAQAANTFILCIIFVGIGLAFGIPWLCCDKYLYRNALVSRSYYFIVKEHSEKYLKEKTLLVSDAAERPTRMVLLRPRRKIVRILFQRRGTVHLPYTELFLINLFFFGTRHTAGRTPHEFRGNVRRYTGFFRRLRPHLYQSDDTTFNFTLLYFDEHGTEREYHYVLNAIRSYTIDIADSNLDVHVALQNAISHSTVAAFNKIKNKLDIEKQKLTM